MWLHVLEIVNCYNERLKKPWSERRLHNNFYGFFPISNIRDGNGPWTDWIYELEPNRDSSINNNNDFYSFSNSSRSEVKTWWFKTKFQNDRCGNRLFFHFHSISFDPSRATKYTNTGIWIGIVNCTVYTACVERRFTFTRFYHECLHAIIIIIVQRAPIRAHSCVWLEHDTMCCIHCLTVIKLFGHHWNTWQHISFNNQRFHEDINSFNRFPGRIYEF